MTKKMNERAKNPAPNQLTTDFQGFKKRYPVMQLKPDGGELLVDTIHPLAKTWILCSAF